MFFEIPLLLLLLMSATGIETGTQPSECTPEIFPVDLNNKQCLGLKEAAQYTTADECREGCCLDVNCEVYQFCPEGAACVTGSAKANACWMGKKNKCEHDGQGWVSFGRNVCTSDLDCSLNGLCTAGKCICDKPWSGTSCETLDFKPAKLVQGYGMVPNVTTWGGGIIRAVSGEHHLYVSRMTNDCLLNTWTKNSRIDHAVSMTGPEGPYTFVDVAVNTWSHNAAPIVLKDGSFAIIHIGTGTGGPNGGANCTSSSPEDEPWSLTSQLEADAAIVADRASGGSTIHISDSLDGPWAPLETSLGSCNNPAPWVHPNGTIFIGCGGKILKAESLQGPWDFVASFPMSGGPDGHYEDPQIYTDKRGNYHSFYHVYRTDLPPTSCADSTVSAHSFSEDGHTWTMSKAPPFGTQVALESGETVTVATRERPKPFFNDEGVMTHLINGVCGAANCTDSKTGCVDCKYNHWPVICRR